MPRVTTTLEMSEEEALERIRSLKKDLNPAESLREVLDELRTLEQKYGMSTLEFYVRYQRGQMGDAEEFMYWAFLYETYVRLTQPTPTPEKIAA